MRPRVIVKRNNSGEITRVENVGKPYTFVFGEKKFIKPNEVHIYIKCNFHIYYTK